ncbi:MAG: NAD(P)/FAD-dependent oxidoreductase [Eubacteriales bacterium]|nr:NAD(P)/FAD-dependent oxidoreductase [Eubacteriales bacterium]
MSYDYTKLLQPIKINGMRLKNRIMMSAMGTFTPMLDGTDSEEGIRYYEERAKGGIGLIMTGAMFLNEKTAQGGPTLALHSTRAIPKATVLTERVHRWGGKICLQMSCGTGRNGMPDIGERVPISSSANPSFYNPEMICRPLETAEIKDIMKDFANAAQFALNAGFDAVEIHGHAGYLIDQFISPQWNTRTDEYGGSWENRVRFATEIVNSIRNVVGPNFPILFRISLDHMYQGGRTLEDSMPIIELLEKAGVDALDIDSGCYETMDYIFPTRYTGEGCMAYVCEEARKHVSIPIINAGNHSMETAVQLLESGNADIISFGRQSIADPEFPKKLKEGRREDIRPCLICNEECIGRIFGRLTQLSCTVNIQVCQEGATQIEKLPKSRKIAVIGAGPGGLEAARVAALRGCDVTVYEASDKIGGTFGAIATAPFKKRIRDLITWYGVQLDKLGVTVKLNTKVTADDPILEDAEEIFVAAGSVPFVPPIAGMDHEKVIDVTQAHIHGVKAEKIVICGGGLSGCDSALELAMDGRDVTIIEMMDACARDVMMINKISIDRMLAEYKVNILTNTKVIAIEEEGVKVEKADGSTAVIPADAVITAFGQRPNSSIAEEIAEKYPLKTTLIGDCQKVSKAGSAIREGFYAAMALQ